MQNGQQGHGDGSVGPALALRLLATTDLHMALLPWDYATGQPDMTQGLARTATLITQARAEVANTLLFDNGDFLQGNALGDYLAHAAHATPSPLPHPMITAMNRLGYDAGALGNHEFSHGLPYLRAALAHARFPILSANLCATAGAPALVPGAVVLRRRLRDADGRGHLLRVGVFGLTPPQTLQWEAHAIGPGIRAEPPLAAARRAVAYLRAAKADVIVALCHSGMGSDDGAEDENFAAGVAGLDGVDAVIAGHEHLLFPPPDAPAALVSGKPVVMAGFAGSHLGVIDLGLAKRDGRWRVDGARAELRALAEHPDLPTNARVARVAARAHRATLDWMGRSIGQNLTAVTTTFALVAPVRCISLIAAAQAVHVAQALAGSDLAHLPLLSAAAPFRAGGRGGPDHYSLLPGGKLTLRDAANLYPHPNLICALRLTWAEVAEWLERAVSGFFQITPGGQDQLLVDPAFPCFDFDMIAGVGFAVDLSQPGRYDRGGHLIHPDARRVRDLTYRGISPRPQDQVVLATNSYRMGGAGGFAPADRARVILAGPAMVRDVVVDHIAGGQPPWPQGGPGWRFAPMPGTTVILPSYPHPTPADLAEVAHLRPTALPGHDTAGYCRYRLHL